MTNENFQPNYTIEYDFRKLAHNTTKRDRPMLAYTRGISSKDRNSQKLIRHRSKCTHTRAGARPRFARVFLRSAASYLFFFSFLSQTNISSRIPRILRQNVVENAFAVHAACCARTPPPTIPLTRARGVISPRT